MTFGLLVNSKMTFKGSNVLFLHSKLVYAKYSAGEH